MKNIDFPYSNAFITYLAQKIENLINSKAPYRGEYWSKLSISNYILRDEDIEGELSDTTIGRFLDTSHPQKPSKKTIKILMQFLFKIGLLTTVEIESFLTTQKLKPPDSSFVITEQKKSEINKICGTFCGVNIHKNIIAITLFNAEFSSVQKMLEGHRTTFLYVLKNLETLRVKTQNFAPKMYNILFKTLKATGAQPLLMHSSQGYAAVEHQFIYFKFQSEQEPCNSLMIAKRVYNSTKPLQIDWIQHFGWESIEGEASFILPKEINSSFSTNLADYCQNIALSKYTDKNVEDLVDGDYKQSEEIKYNKQFTFNMESQFTETAKISEKNFGNVNIRLLKAFQDCGLKEFVNALQNGANPNIRIKNSDPLIFHVAVSRPVEWLIAMIETGKCDLSVKDENGFLPSFRVGVLARQLSQLEITDSQDNIFHINYCYLRQAELNYINYTNLSPK